jgi:hypothetical protein
VTDFPSRQEFVDWLKSKKPGEVVGVSGESCCCPLATFLSWRFGAFSSPEVFPDTEEAHYGEWQIDRLGRHIGRLPAWANLFGASVDAAWLSHSAKVTAATALYILESCSE